MCFTSLDVIQKLANCNCLVEPTLYHLLNNNSYFSLVIEQNQVLGLSGSCLDAVLLITVEFNQPNIGESQSNLSCDAAVLGSISCLSCGNSPPFMPFHGSGDI